MKKLLTSTIFSLLIFCKVFGQIDLPEKEIKRITGPFYIQRTMSLLTTSTLEKQNTVRILIYGQSLSAQDWWLEVRDHLQTLVADIQSLICS